MVKNNVLSTMYVYLYGRMRTALLGDGGGGDEAGAEAVLDVAGGGGVDGGLEQQPHGRLVLAQAHHPLNHSSHLLLWDNLFHV